MALPNNIFTGYNPKQLQTLAQRYGYTDANLDNFGNFLEENPELKVDMDDSSGIKCG